MIFNRVFFQAPRNSLTKISEYKELSNNSSTFEMFLAILAKFLRVDERNSDFYIGREDFLLVFFSGKSKNLFRLINTFSRCDFEFL